MEVTLIDDIISDPLPNAENFNLNGINSPLKNDFKSLLIAPNFTNPSFGEPNIYHPSGS